MPYETEIINNEIGIIKKKKKSQDGKSEFEKHKNQKWKIY